MSARPANYKEPSVYRWAKDYPARMQFKCGGCGEWCEMAEASGLFAGDAPVCESSAGMLRRALLQPALLSEPRVYRNVQ